jgi:hypothetical protein
MGQACGGEPQATAHRGMLLENLPLHRSVAGSARSYRRFAAVLVAVCLGGMVAGCKEKKKPHTVSEASLAETALMADAPSAIEELERRIKAKIGFLNGHFTAADALGISGIYLFSEAPTWLLNCGPIGVEFNINAVGKTNGAISYHLTYTSFTKEDCLTISPALASRLRQWFKESSIK